jgi:hypothetical protein
MENLRVLDVTGQQLSVLPPFPDGLQTLHCDENYLESLPELPDTLEELYCDDNYLKSLPNLPTNLEYLFCSKNKLKSLPVLLPIHLRNLDCQNNLLESLPNLPSDITILNFQNNLVKTIPVLPNNLIELRCSSNKLKSLPLLPNTLKILVCNNNLLRKLPKLPPRLKQLNCKKNLIMRFPTLPKSLTHLISNFDYLHDEDFERILTELQIPRRGNNELDKMTQCKITRELRERKMFQPQWRDFVVPDFFNPTLNGCQEMFTQPGFNNDDDEDDEDDEDGDDDDFDDDDFDDDDEDDEDDDTVIDDVDDDNKPLRDPAQIIKNLPDIKLEKKGRFLIKKTSTGQNIFDRTPDENVLEFLKEADNVVLYFNEQYYLFDRSYFRIVPENLTYICDKAYEHGLDVAGRLKIDENGGHTIYFSMRKLGLFGIVPAHSIKQIVESKKQFFTIESKIPKEYAPSTAGYEVTHNLIDDFASRAHCQEGQGDDVYSVYQCELEATNKRSANGSNERSVSNSRERSLSQTRKKNKNSRERSLSQTRQNTNSGAVTRSQTRQNTNSGAVTRSQSRVTNRGGTRKQKQKQPRKKMV